MGQVPPLSARPKERADKERRGDSNPSSNPVIIHQPIRYMAVVAFITEDAVWTTPHGRLSGREAIEKDYAERSFGHVSSSCSVHSGSRFLASSVEILGRNP